MRKIKKINGWLIVRFNDREKRIYEGTIGSFGVIDAELYTGKLEIDRGAMEYCDAGTQAEAEELARGLDSEETYEDTAEKYILVTEGNDGSTEEEVNPQVMIEGFTRTLESRIGSGMFPDVDAGTARADGLQDGSEPAGPAGGGGHGGGAGVLRNGKAPPAQRAGGAAELCVRLCVQAPVRQPGGAGCAVRELPDRAAVRGG